MTTFINFIDGLTTCIVNMTTLISLQWYDHFFLRLGSKTIFMHWILICLFRDEIALLHSHLLFERQRREVLGARNRRLLGQYSEPYKTVEYYDKIKAISFVFDIVMKQTALTRAQNQLNKLIGSVWTAQFHENIHPWNVVNLTLLSKWIWKYFSR